MFVLIPALEPGPRLPALVAELRDADDDLDILVVDDGSGADYDGIFEEVAAAGAVVIRTAENHGKGAALKRGLGEIAQCAPDAAVVTADADGQHRTSDILKIAEGLRHDAATPTLILGCRDFTGRVPLRSRVGNSASRAIFRLVAGWSVSDTQTGLRGIPASLIPWALSVPGERFEYEQNMLLRCREAGVAAREVPIETIYLEQNASSHFRPLVDSWRVALPLLLFAGSSLLAFGIDTVLMLILSATTGSLLFAIVAARLISASVNFLINRRVVFRARGRDRRRQAIGYAVLALALLASNIVWMQALTAIGLSVLLAKIITEAVLFVTSFAIQRSVVFHRGSPVSRGSRVEQDHRLFERGGDGIHLSIDADQRVAHRVHG